MTNRYLRTSIITAIVLACIPFSARAQSFQDSFESGDLSHVENGVSWGGVNHGSADNLVVSTANAKTGTHSLQFTFTGDPPGGDAWSEQRINLSARSEVWIKYDLYVPLNYYHRSDGASNNKFLALFRNPYTVPGFQMNLSTEPRVDGGSDLAIHRYHYGAEQSTLMPDGARNAISLADRGTWITFIVRVKVPTSGTSNDGIVQVWKNSTPIIDYTNLAMYGGDGENYMDAGYFLGWSNSGFTDTTVIYIDDVTVSTTPLIGGSPDTTAPTVPTGLSATAVSSSQINLSWTAATDAVGVTGYRIYRNGTSLTTTTGTSYSDTGLSASTAYSYTVAAYDAAANTSNQSSAASATTQASAPVTCTSFTYSSWSTCQSDSTQTRTVLTSLPSGCTGGAPVTTQSCTYTPPSGGTISVPASNSMVTLSTTGATYQLTGDITTSGAAILITANNITLDLNGHTVTYDNAGGSAVHGIETAALVSGVTIKNGTVLQGAGNSANSPAIYLRGTSSASSFTVSDLVIRTTGFESDGIENGSGYQFANSTITRCYIETLGGTDNMDGSGADPISIVARGTGGLTITNNILIGGHRGMQIALTDAGVMQTSDISYNRIQQTRSQGSKAPYGILLAKTDNANVHDNQIISDDGRGINLDGWENGTTNGASNNSIYNNRIDVQYSDVATGGAYVENNVYGIRDRYGSGNNSFTSNTIMVTSIIAGEVDGFFIGSDTTDANMVNLAASNNTIIARPGNSSNTGVGFLFSMVTSASVLNNKYIAQTFISGAGNVSSLTNSGNTVLSPVVSTPATPSGVAITKYLDSYLVSWNDNNQADVYEYAVYRDGVKLPISTRGGLFYVDQGIGGTHTYAVSAINLNGVESAPSAAVSTSGGVVTPTTCTSFTYSSWSACQVSNTQTRTVLSSLPSGCTGGSPVTSQSCTYTPPASTTFSTGDRVQVASGPLNVRATASASGTLLGTQATAALGTVSGGPTYADGYSWWNINYDSGVDGWSVENYLTAYTAPSVVTCTSFTYSAWGTCQSDSTQTRTVLTSSPSGCVGGTPVTTQSCTYTPPTSCITSSSAWQNVPFTTQTGTFTATFDATPGAANTGSVMTFSSGNVTSEANGAATTRFHDSALWPQDRYLEMYNGTAYMSALSANYVAGTAYHFRTVVNVPAHTFSVYVTPAGGSEFALGSNYSFRSEQSAVSSLNNFAVNTSVGSNTICNFSVAGTSAPVTCTSFTYSAWGTCQSDSTQTRTVLTSSPSGCVGGTPVTTQSCTYTPPAADTTAPTVPTGLSATAISSSQINLSWSASTDAVGVTGYRVYRNGTQLTTTTGTSYSNTGLAASTAYSYTVAAYDAAGNTSAQSSAASATTQAAVSTPPTATGGNSYIHVAGLAYGRTPAYSTQECTEIGDLFGVVLGSPSELCGSAIRAANPDVILLAYINTSNLTEGDGLYQYAQSHGGVDLFTLNTLSPSVQEIDGQTINLNTGDRVWSYRQGNRWQTDYTSDAARQRLVDYVNSAATTLLGEGWNGFFNDNEDRGCGYSGSLISGSVEGGFTGPADLDQGAQMEANCNTLKKMLDQQVASNVYLVHNTGNFGTRTLHDAPWFWQIGTTQANGVPLSKEYAEAFVDARGALQEFRYSFTNLYGDIDDNYAGINEIWTDKGSPANHLYVMWWLRGGNGSDVAENSDRVKLFALGSHLLYQWSRSFIRYDGSDTNNQPLTGDWFGAMGAPIGNATSAKTALDARTYRRTFQNGVVLVRYRTTWSDNYSDSATYQLGGTYYPVNADGSYGSPVTQVTLHNSEAFIGVANQNY